MSVYLTRGMLKKLNKVTYPTRFRREIENNTSDHWQKLALDGNIKLSQAMICRVCGKDGCTPITEKIDDYSYQLSIQLVANVTIDTVDSLPKYICTECIEKLQVALDFKKMCEASERKFKKILNPMGDPTMHSYPYSKHDFQLILHNMKLKKTKKYEEKMKQKTVEKTKEKPKTKLLECPSCDMSFCSKDQLQQHRKDKLCMKRACDICGQLVDGIKVHMRQVHKKVNIHECPHCGKKFPIYARLKNHMVVHTDTFKFFCDLCPYKSKHKHYLVMHMRTHTGEKPYKCPQCPSTFVNPSNLNKHKLIHQEKQFKCMLCEKSFRTSVGLREHHSATHMNIKHTCNTCGRDFCYRTDLRKHEIRNHNRSKRDYIGGEPSYKQVERLQKMQDTHETHEIHETHETHETHEILETHESHNLANKVFHQELVITPSPQIIQAAFIDANKDYRQTNQAIYFSDVSGMITQQPLHQMVAVPPQTVELAIPELTMKKDDGKITYEAHQIGYY